MDEINLYMGEDGKFKEYKDDFDIIIHNETQEDYDTCINILQNGANAIKIIEDVKKEIDFMKKTLIIENSDYLTGYISSLLALKEFIYQKEIEYNENE